MIPVSNVYLLTWSNVKRKNETEFPARCLWVCVWALLQVFDRNISPSAQGVWPFPPPDPLKLTERCQWPSRAPEPPRLPTIAQTLTDYGSLETTFIHNNHLRPSLIHFCASVFEQWPSFTIVDVLQLHGVISAEAHRQEVCLFLGTESNPWNDNCQHIPVCVSWCHGRWECLPITQSCEFDALIPRTCVNCKQLASAHLSRFLTVSHIHPSLCLSLSPGSD